MDFLSRRRMQGENEALHGLFEAKWKRIESLSGTQQTILRLPYGKVRSFGPVGEEINL